MNAPLNHNWLQSPLQAFKKRTPRKPVLLRGKLRHADDWHEVGVLNVSARGILVSAPRLPTRGTYVELQIGSHALVARVAWRNGQRAGLSAQDTLPVSLVASGAAAAQRLDDQFGVQGGSARSHANRHEESRWQGRALEFASFVFASCAAGLIALTLFDQAVAKGLGVALGLL